MRLAFGREELEEIFGLSYEKAKALRDRWYQQGYQRARGHYEARIRALEDTIQRLRRESQRAA